jgi:hypothetical protein
LLAGPFFSWHLRDACRTRIIARAVVIVRSGPARVLRRAVVFSGYLAGVTLCGGPRAGT